MKPILWWVVLLGIFVQQTVSEKVQCFSEFSLSTGKCGDLIGEVEKKHCCMNPNYGFIEAGGVCKYCGRAAWTEWSSWGACSMSCTEGVTQRRRSCYGIGVCSDPEGLGAIQTKPCVKKDCCPVQGGWSEWKKWQPCSVTCERGFKKRQRTCSNPVPQCGGSCIGEVEEITSCTTETICPTHGGWSSWGSWSPCPGTCINEGHNTQKELRKRTCTNPPPSTIPRGNYCDGSDTDSRPCSGLPFCPIDGNWGPWSGLTPCSVTCGVGKQIQKRKCDSPKPKHGGRECHGDEQKTGLCITSVPCPIHGMWTDWSNWGPCKQPSTRKITCRIREGTRRRERNCVGREYEGNFCDGQIVQHGKCYDVDGCEMKSVLTEWSEWSYCKPDCGPNSAQIRERKCVPDISEYRSDNHSIFSGKPNFFCEDLKEDIERRPCNNVPECKDKGN